MFKSLNYLCKSASKCFLGFICRYRAVIYCSHEWLYPRIPQIIKDRRASRKGRCPHGPPQKLHTLSKGLPCRQDGRQPWILPFRVSPDNLQLLRPPRRGAGTLRDKGLRDHILRELQSPLCILPEPPDISACMLLKRKGGRV